MSVSNESYILDLDISTEQNPYYRRVLHTTPQSQLVLMSLNPGQEIGMEIHEGDQFIKVEEGTGYAILDEMTYSIEAGAGIVIAAGTNHNIIATQSGLKLYVIYTPPEHPANRFDEMKPADE